MKTNIKLAWRNIWRNRRRTFITAASIMFAVVLSTFMEAVQKGGWDQIIDNMVSYYFGYAQVHQDGYWEEQTLDKAFPLEENLLNLSEELDKLERVVPRLESFALASYHNKTRGVLLIGTKPEVENKMTKLESRISQGSYFEAGENAVLVGEGVAKILGMELGDTIVLISQGYHGVNAAGKYPIKGIIKFASPELNKQLVYLPLEIAQYFYGAENLVTSLALQIENKRHTEPVVQQVANKLNSDQYEVMGWEELLPDLVEAKEMKQSSSKLISMILYLIITFGVFGTILMMLKEREYEFGVLVSIGMKRRKLSSIIWLEIVMLGFIGVLAGMVISVPLVYYFNINPINFSQMAEGASDMYDKFGFDPVFPAAFEPMVFISQALLVFIITTLLALYPIWKIRKMKPIEAMRA
jgi:putative ABC transport system permease protein